MKTNTARFSVKRLCAFLFCAAILFALTPMALNPAAAASETLLYSFTFDDEAAQGAYFTFGEAVTGEWVNSPGAGFESDTALKLTHIGADYTSSSNTAILTLPEPLPAGGIYRIVAHVYAATEENPGKRTLTGPGFVLNNDYGGAQGEVKFPPDFGTLPMDEWKTIDVTLPMRADDISSLDFRIVINDADKHPDVWYWDGIEIYQVGELGDASEVLDNPLSDDGYPIVTKNKSGNFDDFNYELWSENSSDNVAMALTGGGTFQCVWNAKNILFRIGQKLGSTKTYEEYGDITLDYAAEWNITRGDVNYLCVYGWTEDPMIEFYIIENHGSYKPGSKSYGTYVVDGSTYELYTATRVNMPSIQGTKTFEQYFGIRVDKRTEGTIAISDHFKAWENLGLDMSGKMYEFALCVEGFNSGGTAVVYKNKLTVGDETYGTDEEAPKTLLTALMPEPSEPPAAPPSPSPVAESPEATVEPSPEPSPAETPDSGEESGEPSNLPLIIGIAAGVLVVIGGAIAVFMKKKK